MVFIDRLAINRLIWLGTLSFLAVVLSSCGSVVDKSSSDTSTEEVAEGAEEIRRVASPNPYLASAPRVSQQAINRFNSGISAMESGNWSEAELIFQELTVTEPGLSGPWVNLGTIYYQAEDFDKAESAWNQAIEINSLNFDAYNQLAILKREQGEFDEAEAIYLNSLAKWPDNAEAHRNLGILYDLYMGQWVEALNEYQECADLSEEPSRQLRGWIVDMERRIQALANDQR